MNLRKILDLQRELDKSIHFAHEIDKTKNLKTEKILAFFVELGELANEIQFFKYWKKDKKLDWKKILEEYSDGLHFLSSFILESNGSEIIEPIVISNNLNFQFLEILKQINELEENFSKKSTEKIFSLYLGIAKILKISDEEIEAEYIKKNIINHERIKNKY
ncbi:dUTP diphosphatase [[Mycoplasma] mobile]|uniref:Expressed protein n=1 Tax=Mycoplasma mobile (strain ATCC 43663 / 163K / NCTC 11711) TaxID=267748 RepID=Q6KI21_MYCM1|nr:dUTP diphosphatase [[Mycoplasma] mobile]AAT27755.1 expressed protein [Mycoplasma mobile 163K]